MVARGAHLEAIQRDGLAVDSSLGTFTVRVGADQAPGALAPADAVLVAVKSWQVAEVAPSLAPLVAGGGVAIPLQNGVEAADRLAAVLGPERVAGGTITVLAWIAGAGRVQHVGPTPRLILGERGPLASRPSPRLEAIAAALRAAGAEAAVTPEIESAVWEKFLFVEPLGAIGAVSRAPVGVLRSVHRDARAPLPRAGGIAAPREPAASRFLPTPPPGRSRAWTRSRPTGRSPCSATSERAARPSSRISPARSCASPAPPESRCPCTRPCSRRCSRRSSPREERLRRSRGREGAAAVAARRPHPELGSPSGFRTAGRRPANSA